MASNPDMAYADQSGTVKQQTYQAGGEQDVEAGTIPQDYSQQPQVTVTSTTTRQTVRPSPTHANVTTSKQQQQQTTTTSGGGFLGNFLNRSHGRYFFALHAAIAFFSFMVFVSSALIEDNTTVSFGNRFAQYEMLIAELSFAISLGSCVMDRVGLLENRHIRIALSAFQVFFWAPALVIMTFYGSYLTPLIAANGFFGAWGAFLASAVIFAHETDRVARDPRASSAPRTSLLVIFFTALMVMGAGIRVYYNRGTTSSNPLVSGEFDASYNYTVFAIAYGAITAFLAALFLVFLDAMPEATMLGLGTVFWIWVALGMLLLTFVDPFEQAFGNGYYAVFFCLLASFGLLVSLRRARKTSSQNARETDEDRESAASAAFFLFMRGLAFASLVELIAASLICRNEPGGGCPGRIPIFQVCVGAVSLGITLIVVLLEAFGLYRVSSYVKMAIAFLLWAWWVAGFIVLTFYGSFQSPTFRSGFYANGFFFTWVGLVFASLAFAESLKDRARYSDPPSLLTAKTGFLLLVIVGSAIELGAAIKWYYDTNHSGLSKYAIALGASSIGWVLIMYFVLLCVRSNYDAHDGVYNFGLYLLTLWWAVGALIVTYMGLWTAAVDNGYFSVFFTLGTCLLALSGIWRTDDDDMVDTDRRDYQGTTSAGATTTNQQYAAATTTTTSNAAARY